MQKLAFSALIGGGVHTLFCWFALELGFFRGDDETFQSIFGFIWSGHLLVLTIIVFGIGRYFRPAAATMPLMLWCSLALLLSAYYVDQVRLCVMAFFFGVIQMGAFTGHKRHFFMIATIAVIGYLAVVLVVAQQSPESIDLTAEIIQWAAFAILTLGYAALAADINRMRMFLRSQNNKLQDLVQRIEELAITDELTGAYNRRQAMKILRDEVQMSQRHDSELCICYMDLDLFKKVNDTYGHSAGDAVLRVFSKFVQSNISAIDSFARLGGEEFLLVCVRQSLGDVQNHLEAMREKVAELTDQSWPDGMGITASFGLAEFDRKESVENLLARADAALYKAKATGRNKVVTDVVV